MNVLAWILGIALALVYLAAGGAKVTQSRDKLLAQPNMAWVNDFSGSQVKMIGTLELLGAVGVVVPWLIDVAPALTPIAGIGLAALQGGAMITHFRRGERQMLPINLVLLIVALVFAVLRFGQL
jgi:hypothetical protein